MSSTPSTSSGGAPVRRVFQVAYSTISKKDPRLHQVRDSSAAAELMAALTPLGFAYETALHFYPGSASGTRLSKKRFNFLREGDMLLLTTRPPLEGRSSGAMLYAHGLVSAQNALEDAIFEAIARFFIKVGRFAVDLTEGAAAWLHDESKDMACLTFSKKNHGLITGKGVLGRDHAYVTTVSQTQRVTAGYFVHLGRIPPFPCGLILSFGISGVENLLWNRIVRREYAAWLAQPVFACARFRLPPEAEYRPLSAQELVDHRSKQLQVTLLAEHWL